jgi:manganese/zinc/iron transport system substrate-binding protein
MSDADVIFYNGLHLEGAMNEVFEQMSGKVKTFAVADGIDHQRLIISEGSEGTHDPHIWFDVSLWKEAIEYIGKKLMELDPNHLEIYQKNTDEYLAELEALHQYAIEKAATVQEGQRVLITAHDAFNYFGKAYGFQVRGLQGISTAAEAGTADVQELSKFIAENKIPAVFVESSVPRRNIEAVQAAVKARGFNVGIGGELFSDAMGTKGTPEGNYPGMVRHNVDTIIDALISD